MYTMILITTAKKKKNPETPNPYNIRILYFISRIWQLKLAAALSED